MDKLFLDSEVVKNIKEENENLEIKDLEELFIHIDFPLLIL
jgi:hypothetical protein